MQNNLFKKSSMERITSPEKLNDFIQVANPASWMVLGAALALLIGLLVWGFLGQLTQTAAFNGHVKDGVLYCYAPGHLADQLYPGMEADILPQASGENSTALRGKILTVSDQPLSFDEAARDITSDYMLSSLGISGWNFAVTLEADGTLYEGMVYTVNVVTDTMRPIEMVFR